MVGIPRGRTPPLAFGISTRRTGGAKVRPRRHPVPDLEEIPLQILLEGRDGDAIHARRPTIFFHLFPGVPNEAFGNVIWLRLRHRLLPSPVGRFLWLEDRVPSLRPSYWASPLLRTRPSLCRASVLCL